MTDLTKMKVEKGVMIRASNPRRAWAALSPVFTKDEPVLVYSSRIPAMIVGRHMTCDGYWIIRLKDSIGREYNSPIGWDNIERA